MNRCEPRLAELAVDVADLLLDLLAQAAVVGNAAARGHSELQEKHLLAPLRLRDQEPAVRLQAQRDALAVVETVHAEHDASIRHATAPGAQAPLHVR